VSGRNPTEIWEESLDEGERRLMRRWTGLAATGLAGGIDVFFSILALAVVSAGLHEVLPEQTSHVLASVVFGIGFAFITLGRAELFTENFLLPVGAVFSGRARVTDILRMWLITMVFNLIGLLAFAAMFSVQDVLKPATLETAGTLADTLGDRGALAAFLSAIAAGTIMTLFTWVAAAAETASARIVASLIVGLVLALPSLNHAIVGFGEMAFGILAGTAESTWGDLARNFGLAVAGNLVGGVGLVFSTRLAQVRGEPGSQSGASGPKARRDARASNGAAGDGEPSAAANR
jgi:formate/nitrite transporter FocA (FNT family)